MSATTNKPDKDTAFVVLDQEEADRQYQASHDVLEKIRRQSREARARLIEAIMCDRKDVLSEKDFPLFLAEIPDAPKKLYYHGTLPDWSAGKFLCVVGARKYSNYGKEV